MKFDLILADVPWSYNDKSMQRGGAERHYRTLPLPVIKSFGSQLSPHLAQNAVLLFWCTSPFLNKAFEVIHHWGFEYKTVAFVWVKTNRKSGTMAMGMGHYTRSNAEFLLLAKRGKGLPVIRRDILNVQMAPRQDHSAKPPEFYPLIESLFQSSNRLELFSRNKRDGWTCWGDEINSDIHLEI